MLWLLTLSLCAVTIAQSFASLPQCGQDCTTEQINIMNSLYGCQAGNATCYCSDPKFAYGLRDCSLGRCGSAVEAQVLAFGQAYCAQALPGTSSAFVSTPSTTLVTSSATATTSIASTVSSATAVSAETSSPSNASATPAPSDGLSTGAKAGLGVGVGLGVIIVIIAAFLLLARYFQIGFTFQRKRAGPSSASHDTSYGQGNEKVKQGYVYD